MFNNACSLLKKIVDENLIRASGVYGLWPAGSDGDSIVVFEDEACQQPLARLEGLRQQVVQRGRNDFRCLADYVAPIHCGRVDYVGAFAVTAGLGVDELAVQFDTDQDDYSAIMVKALADRLVEAFAEKLHKQVRDQWGCGDDESLTNEALIAEAYRGIRPAPGYPSQPDHTEKNTIFDLLNVQKLIGIELTESLAMRPAASVSGLYFCHPQARYFNVGKLGRDQVEDYAHRKEMTLEEAERWLAPHLGYS